MNHYPGIDVEQIAHVCHEANRALQVTQGDPAVSPHFMEAAQWQVDSAFEGVEQALAGSSPEELHESWTKSKIQDGWCYGQAKDAAKKTHPCVVPYSELPAEQRLKDLVFHAVVGAFAQHHEGEAK
ncbi:RyR domain-containing protein [Arthrobacter sp. UYCu712]|uniref:RyR domain-containing protein n=1 Tax=Arthrobacter sp. UYCu712 TaxID=3156340 RepID=UPI0033999DD1